MTNELRRRGPESPGRDTMPRATLRKSESEASFFEESRDWLGRGGLMGFPWAAFPSNLSSILLSVRVYFLSAVWLAVAFQYFVWQLPLLALLLIPDGGATYKRAATIYDAFAQPAVLAVPFSWCGFRVWTASPGELYSVPKTGSAVFMTNHSSRIDWLIGLLVGQTIRPVVRVGFVAEFTTMLMPVFGWSRGLFGDIFLRRTFHRDAGRIKENIKSFHRACVDRILFLAPEGAIVDPGVERDAEYVANCRRFCRDLGRGAMEYVLTPRYKGMQLIALHAPKGIFSVTMTFVCPDAAGKCPVVNPKTHEVSGGYFCTRPLDDPDRIIPDLHTIFRGGLQVFTQIVQCDGDRILDGDRVRDALLDDYERKDALLKAFYTTGKYAPDAELHELPINHARMNGTVVALLSMSAAFLVGVCQWTALEVVRFSTTSFLALFTLHAVTHIYAEQISGASRESLVFETILKALMQWWMGGKLDHGGTSKAKTPKSPPPSPISKTASTL